jgi:hypothetical protein
MINPRPPPKNGIFYTISELKELGEDVSNHFGEAKSKKKRESKTKEIPEEFEYEEEKVPEEKEKKKRYSKKTEKKITTPKTKKTTTTSTRGNKAKVSKEDKVSWITQNGRRVMIYNGVKKQGATAHAIWEEYQKLNPSPSKRKKKESDEKEEAEEILPKKKSKKKETTENIVETNQELMEKYIKKNPSNTIFKNVNKSKKPVKEEETIEIITDSD